MKALLILALTILPLAAKAESLNCKDPETQMEMNACAWQDERAAEKAIGTKIATASAKAQAIANSSKSNDLTKEGAESVIASLKLVKANLALIGARCDLASPLGVSGSIAPLDQAECLTTGFAKLAKEINSSLAALQQN